MSEPFFSVIVPTFERPQQLRGCLAALTAQDYPTTRFEVLVVDDGSSATAAAEVARVVAEAGGRLLRQSNRGPAAARNHGAREARGDYLAFTDDDCTAAPDWLRRLAVTIERVPDHAIGGRTLNGITGNVFSEGSQVLVDYLYAYYDGGKGAFFTSNNVALPRRVFEAVGGFDERFLVPAAEDRELFDRWRFHGHGALHDDEAVVYHQHTLTLRSFWRQHFTYGRGAWHYHQARAQREQAPIRLEPLHFYGRLLASPFTRTGFPAALFLTLLLLVSQIATGAGFFYERLRHAGRGRSGLIASLSILLTAMS